MQLKFLGIKVASFWTEMISPISFVPSFFVVVVDYVFFELYTNSVQMYRQGK